MALPKPDTFVIPALPLSEEQFHVVREVLRNMETVVLYPLRIPCMDSRKEIFSVPLILLDFSHCGRAITLRLIPDGPVLPGAVPRRKSPQVIWPLPRRTCVYDRAMNMDGMSRR